MAAACARGPAPVPEPAPAPGAWLEQARRTHSAFPSFEATYRGVWDPGDGRARSLRLWVAADGAQRLRVEVTGRLGGTLLTLVANEGEILAVSPRAGEHVRERAMPGWIGAVSGWPVEADELAGLLLADLPARLGLRVQEAVQVPGVHPAGPEEEREEIESALRQETRAASRRYLLRSRGSGIRRLEIEEDGRAVADVTFQAWSAQQGTPVPSELRIARSGPDPGTLALRLESISPGPATPGAFDLDPPAGSRRIRIPAGGGELPGWGFPEEGS